jgi:hypothetical protein
MTRKARSDGRSDGTRTTASRVHSSGHISLTDPAASPHEPSAHTLQAGPTLARLVDRFDGWLRIVSDGDTGQVYIKWKFTRGHWRGHYVMAVVQYWQLGYGFQLLLDKLAAVEEGTFKPTLDTPFS